MEADILIYIMKSSISISIFYLYYRIAIMNKVNFKKQRYYILLGIIVSLVFPLFHLDLFLKESDAAINTYLLPIVNVSNGIVNSQSSLAALSALFSIYLIGVVIFLSKFILQLFQLLSFIRANKIVYENEQKIVEIESSISPFSFMNIVFINKNDLNEKDYASILTHEKAHSKQMHSLDNILLELVSIVLWFNPFVWLIKRSLKEVHEYLADSETILSGINISEYKTLLLKQLTNTHFTLANNIHSAIIKRRLSMMTNAPKNQKSLFLRLVILIPIIFSITFFNSINTDLIASEQEKKVEKKSKTEKVKKQKFDKLDEYPNCDMKELNKLIKYPEEARKKGLQGQVILKILVGIDGTAKKIEVEKSDNIIFNEAAVSAAEKVKFTPGKIDGQSVATWIMLPIQFRLK